jgi:hypothetical protein
MKRYLQNINPLHFSCYPKFRNTVLDYCGDDSTGEPLQWYKINDQGFRGNDFENSTDILFLGCSITFGVAMPPEEIFAHLVAQELNCSYANISKPSAAPDTCFRFAQHWIPKLNPKHVVYLQPPYGRFEILVEEDGLHQPGIINAHTEENVYYELTKNSTNIEINYLKNKLAINHVCSDHGAIFHFINPVPYKDLARDDIHPGKDTHKYIADSIINKIRRVG